MSARYHTHESGIYRAPLRWVFFLLLATLPGFTALAQPALPSARAVSPSPSNTVVVTTTADHVDGDTSSLSSLNNDPGTDGAISFREALLAANLTLPATHELTVTFSIPITDSGHSLVDGRDIWTIGVGSEDDTTLPTLSRGRVLVDGSRGSPGSRYPSIVLDGISISDSTSNRGLTITSAENEVRGLTIANFFNDGIMLQGSAAAYNRVAGCYIGTDASGRLSQPNGSGIYLLDGAHDNLIGGFAPAERNLISGNSGDAGDAGVWIEGSTTMSNTIAGNWIGVDSSGLAALSNSGAGVHISGGARHNLIGGPAGARNLIAGNDQEGVYGGVGIEGPATANNTVAGNWIGVDTTGHAALGNNWSGVYISDGAHDNRIGIAGQGNLISGNQSGIFLSGGAANQVVGNTIGLASDGKTALPNRDAGIYILDGAHDNLIGGTTVQARNIISNNGVGDTVLGHGIYVYGTNTTNNVIQGNYIGVDASGVAPAGNRGYGVVISVGANGNALGGVGAGNVIAYNGYGGIWLHSDRNRIAGNKVGVGADGATGLGNQSNGIDISGSNNFVGPNNLIAYNQQSGIRLSGTDTTIISNSLNFNARSGICVEGTGTQIMSNTINYNGVGPGAASDCGLQGGVVITGTGQTSVLTNTIWYNHGPGITVRAGLDNSILANSISYNDDVGIRLLEGGNRDIPPPVGVRASESHVSGQSCGGCHVEIFTDEDGEGRNFITSTTALPNGYFSVPLRAGILDPPFVTATNTDTSGNTSAFTQPVPVANMKYAVNLPIVRLR